MSEVPLYPGLAGGTGQILVIYCQTASASTMHVTLCATYCTPPWEHFPDVFELRLLQAARTEEGFKRFSAVMDARDPRHGPTVGILGMVLA